MSTPRLTDIIQQYDGSTDFAEWVKKLELVAKLQKIGELANFLPLFLTGNAFAVYDSLSDSTKADYDQLKDSLIRAFSLDAFSAFERFINRRYVSGESVDVYLSDLRRLIGLIGDTDEMLKCAFVSGLPTNTRNQLKAASSLESMSLADVAERARTINLPGGDATGAVAARKTPAGTAWRKPACFRCGEDGHLSRSCPTRKTRGRCFLCDAEGHFVAHCPRRKDDTKPDESKNEVRGAHTSAPASSRFD